MSSAQVDSLETFLAAIGRSLLPGGEERADTAAGRAALTNREGNLAALAKSQPEEWELIEKASLPPLEWLFGRDGSLTGREPSGAWWGGSSLPYRVGEALLKSLEPAGQTGCFLCPTTAGQVRAALEKLGARRALVAVIPDVDCAAVMLRCHDFSGEIEKGRLWLAVGDNWPEGLSRIFAQQRGLSVPQQFIRTGLLNDEALSEMAAIANPVLGREIQRRAELATEIRARVSKNSWRGKPPCIVAGSGFRLWDLAGLALRQISAEKTDWKQLDIDQPASASLLIVAMAAEQCGGIVTGNLYRADRPGLIPDQMPWVTWTTDGRIMPYVEGMNDHLLMADTDWIDNATAAGWPRDRVYPAAWPELAAPTPTTNKQVALIGDAVDMAMPERLREFSSHGLLWENIAVELIENPHAVGNDAVVYLENCARRLGIDVTSLDRPLFMEKLILSQWRRGMANVLSRKGLDVVCYGAGWETTRLIESMEQLTAVAQQSSALVCPFPTQDAHAVDFLGRPVIRAGRAKTRPVNFPRLAADLVALAISRS